MTACCAGPSMGRPGRIILRRGIYPLAAVPADHILFKTCTRRDAAHAGAGERPTNDDYAGYIRYVDVPGPRL